MTSVWLCVIAVQLACLCVILWGALGRIAEALEKQK